jgi:hypothetical protein
MRGSIAWSLLVASAALLPPPYAAGEEPTRMVGPARGSPSHVVRAARARGNPPIPTKRRVMVPSISGPSHPPEKASPEPPRTAVVTRNCGDHVQAELPLPVAPAVGSVGEITENVVGESAESETVQGGVEQSAFLLPIWHPGFWAMPPGGMTRFLIPSRTFVNPDETLISAAVRTDGS